MVGSLDINEALVAYASVERFSSTNASDGDRHAIMRQYELPPMLCFSRHVSLESRYGMCWSDAADFLPPFADSARAVIT